MFKTSEELQTYLKTHVSEKRYIHSLGVATTTEMILKHYRCSIEHYGNFDSAVFVGLAHDLGREMKDEEILQYCRDNSLCITEEQEKAPILAHGLVSADIAKKLCGSYPESWRRAICVHTTGNSDMDELALALFIADYLEPSRVFLTDEKRQSYLSEKTIQACALRILRDMIDHWQEKGLHAVSPTSKRMLESLKGCCK